MITKLSLLLVLLSSMIHPLWNMLLKKSSDKVVFYLNIHLIFTVLFSFILFIYPVGNITLLGWALVFLSACTHFFYQVYLCRTYELEDMSLTYPIARSAPIFVVVMGILFLRELPSKGALAGICILMLGVYLLNQQRFSLASFFTPLRHIKKRAMVMAGMTAFWSACYSIVDKKGVLLMDPVLFFYLFFAISGAMFLVYVVFLKERRKKYLEVLKADAVKITLAALMEFGSYILILFAFRISNTAYVIALRQISVVFGALYGICFLKERYGTARMFGSLVIFVGVFLITVFG